MNTIVVPIGYSMIVVFKYIVPVNTILSLSTNSVLKVM